MRLAPPSDFDWEGATVWELEGLSGEVNLGNIGSGDHIIRGPNSGVFEGSLRWNGSDLARHVYMAGFEICPPLVWNKTTMRMNNDSDWFAYNTIAFTGVTAGSFQINCHISGSNKKTTAPIAFNASNAAIKAAINAATAFSGQPDACFAVDGPDTALGADPGGPWKIVPALNAGLGRAELVYTGPSSARVPTGLTGPNPLTTAAHTAVTRGGGPMPHLLIAQWWTGQFHTERMFFNSLNGTDGVNNWNYTDGAIATCALSHYRALNHQFHDDIIHVDGMQNFCGPSKFFAEKCDFISKGGNGLIQQPREVGGPLFPPRGTPPENTSPKLAALYDSWFKDCQFRAYVSNEDPRREQHGDNALACFAEGDQPSNTKDLSAWMPQFQNSHADLRYWADPDTNEILGDDLIADKPICGVEKANTRYWNMFKGDPANQSTPIAGGYTYGQVPVPSGLTIRSSISGSYSANPDAGKSGATATTSPGYTGDALPTVTRRIEENTAL